MRIYFTILFLLISNFILSQSIVINEIMSSNKSTILDEDNDASDWIELYNGSDVQINLNGFSLTDDSLNIQKWQFGNTVMEAKGHLLIYASGKDRQGSPLHTNFKINASGEKIILSNSSGDIIDEIYVPASSIDISYGRMSDGLLTWIFQTPTPGSANSGHELKGYADSVKVSLPAGFYSSEISVTLSAGDSKIYYTLDGSYPDNTSAEYKTPLNINTTSVLKAISYKENCLPGNTITGTYFINESTDLPVISLSADPFDLFDTNYGIYTNYTQNWERPAHVEFFEDDKSPGFSENCGIEIVGSQSAEWAQKSFAVKFRSDYGVSKIKYPLFPGFHVNTFKAFKLRNSGNDFQYTHIRDAMMQSLVKDLDIDYQEYRPATSFINGEYWGIYNIRERIDKDYISYRHPEVKSGNIDLLENNMNVIEGDSLSYLQLIDYISTNNMSTDAAYAYLDSVIDLDECILYFAAQAYYDNMDWPGTNNKFWRERSASGKWRWILFDLDFGFGLYAHGPSEDHIAFMFSTVETRYSNPPWATLLQRKLVENPVIKNRFINQIADLLNTNFKSTRVIDGINTMANHIANELPKHRARWGLTGENLNKMTTFAQQRPAYLRTHVRNYFRCGEDGTLYLNSSTGGKVKLNTLYFDQTNLPWSGVYFQGNDVHLKAIPLPGYKFDGWSGDVISGDESIAIKISRTTNLTATFSKEIVNSKDIVINEINYNPSKLFKTGDWVELYNNSKDTVDLSNWSFSDSDPIHKFIFPTGTLLSPDKYLVLVEKDSSFMSYFPNVLNYIGEIGFGLDGAGEFIKLEDEDNQLIDSLTYDDKLPWPVEPDGSGATLELVDPSSDNSISGNWKSSNGNGSPGAKNSVLSLAEENPIIPKQYCLFQNYPNPFNPSTVISYQLAVNSKVTLRIFNFLGEEVTTLINEFQNAGFHSTLFTLNSSLPSGIYFYQIRANGFNQTKKMIVIK